MKIVGGFGRGSDCDKSRIIEIEPGDVGKQLRVSATWETVDDGVDLVLEGRNPCAPDRQGYPVEEAWLLDDPVETAGPAAPFWVRPEREPLALAPGETVEDLRHYKVAPEPLSDEARAIITGKALPQAAEAAQGWVASREDILKALAGQIVDADANASRYPADSLRRAELIVTRDTLKGVKRMMERKARA